MKKIVSSFMVINVNNSDRVSFTFDEVNENGELVRDNVKETFFAVNPELEEHINAIRKFINDNKLS